MTIGAKKPIVIVNSSMLRWFDDKEVETVLGHEAAHVLSEHYTYTTALVLLSQFLQGALPRSLLLGLPVRAIYLALWSGRGRRALGRPGAARVMATRCNLPRVDGAGRRIVPGMNFEAFLKQANDYDGEDDLFSRHTRFWSELNLTHPVAVRRVKELMEWVQTGAYDRIRDGDYPRGTRSPRPRRSSRMRWRTTASASRGSWTGRPAGCRRRPAPRQLARALPECGDRRRQATGTRTTTRTRTSSRTRTRAPGTNRAPCGPSPSRHIGALAPILNRAESHNAAAGDRRTAVQPGDFGILVSRAVRSGWSRARLKGTCRMVVVQGTETVGLTAYRMLFAHSSEGVLFCTEDGRITAANPAACAMLDMSAEAICALGRDGLVDQEDPRWDIAVAERERTDRRSAWPGCAGATAATWR